VNAIVAIARADLLERTRTFAILIVVAALLELGYLFVPDRSAAYSMVDLGGWRGIYDSAWMGTINAILTITFLSLVGFFLIRPAQSRDAVYGTYDIVAASPLPRTMVALGKWTSNVALLVVFAALLGVAAIAMQLVRGEDRSIDVLAYLLPFAIVTVPACAITATLAMAITAIPGLRGIGGGIVWFFVWAALFVVPGQIAGNGTTALDPLGMTVLTASLLHGLAAAEPHVHIGNDFSIGFSEPSKHVFRFVGIPWSETTIAVRAIWSLVAIAIAAAVSSFALVRTNPRARGRFAELPARLVALVPLPPLLRAELGATLGEAGPYWLAGMVGVTIAALAVPVAGLARVVSPLVWIWPIGPIAFATVMDVRANCEDVLRATPTPSWRRALARTTSCFLVAAVPVAALALRDGGAGIVALLPLAFAAAAFGVALGALARSPLPFEGIVLLGWYVGAVNHVPALDPASATRHPLATLAACVTTSVVALAITAWRIA
jgi:ABC-type transport system involved in multi-copper enzyme maturation permease subunit